MPLTVFVWFSKIFFVLFRFLTLHDWPVLTSKLYVVVATEWLQLADCRWTLLTLLCSSLTLLLCSGHQKTNTSLHTFVDFTDSPSNKLSHIAGSLPIWSGYHGNQHATVLCVLLNHTNTIYPLHTSLVPVETKASVSIQNDVTIIKPNKINTL